MTCLNCEHSSLLYKLQSVGARAVLLAEDVTIEPDATSAPTGTANTNNSNDNNESHHQRHGT